MKPGGLGPAAEAAVLLSLQSRGPTVAPPTFMAKLCSPLDPYACVVGLTQECTSRTDVRTCRVTPGSTHHGPRHAAERVGWCLCTSQLVALARRQAVGGVKQLELVTL